MTTLLSEGLAPILTAGPLSLDTASRKLSGPKDTTVLDRGTALFLGQLMRRRWSMVAFEDLMEMAWGCADAEPDNARAALRSRAQRARDAMHRVGVSPARLRTVHGQGYQLEGEPRIVRVLTPAQAAALDALAATHPAFQTEQAAA